MKNKIVLIVLTISILFLVILAVFGFKIGKFEIPSISKIIEKNKNVNADIDKLSNLTSTTYPQKVKDIETTINDLSVQKQKYEEISGYDSEEENIVETQQYDITYLWTKLGKLASKQKISLSMEVKQASGSSLYDLYFTIGGEYVNISSFVKKLEDESDLSFRIYNFKLVPGSSSVNLKATFTVKNVNINSKTLIKNTGSTQSSTNNNNTETNNVSNTTTNSANRNSVGTDNDNKNNTTN